MFPSALTRALLALLVLVAIAVDVSAEMLRPGNLEYDFESDEGATSKSCRVVLVLTNLPAPEGVNFKVIAVRGKVQKLTFIGFSLDVGDMVFVSGLPAGMQKATL